MKIIQINVVYGQGSTGKIVKDLHESYLNNNIDSYVIYGLGDKTLDENVFKVANNVSRIINTPFTYMSGYMYKGSMFVTKKIIRLIQKIQPDVVHVHCVNGHMLNIYKLFEYLKKNKIRTVLTNHAEFMYTGSYTYVPDGSNQWLTGEHEKYSYAKKLTNSWFFDRTHKALMKTIKVFNNYDDLVVASVSPWVQKRSEKSLVFKNHTNLCVLNGINTEVFKIDSDKDLIKKFKPKNEKIVLHVTSGFNNYLKGGALFTKIASKFLGSNIKFILIGVDDLNLDLPENVINIGKVKNQKELAKFYSIADVTLLTSKKETFSMIVAESLCCGTPVVGFKAGGPETISIPEYSDFVEYGDVDALETLLRKWCSNTDFDRRCISDIAKQKYDLKQMSQGYVSCYTSLVNNNLK